MTAERWARLVPLIDAALDLEHAQRLDYIERACAGDLALRADLERMLAECERSNSLIDRAADERSALLMENAPQGLPEILSDRFIVEREIGRGGMATVFLGHDRKHDRPVAIKVLRREIAASIGPERFLREIRTAARLQHPHIVPLHDSGKAEGILYFVMAYVGGESLRDRLEREPQLPLDEALRITQDVADALDYAHANGVVHRDIKPENILLSRGHALVTDFGIARAVSASDDNDRITFAGFTVGTPAYMSPEQAAAGRVVDGRADIYALGCVLYEMLAGHPPFLGTTAQEVLARHSLDPLPPLHSSRVNVPNHIERAVAKALAKAPADRFGTAGAFSAACLQSETQRGPLRLSRRLIPLAAAAAVILAAFAFFKTSDSRTDRAPVSAGEATPSIAVLAFKNIGRDSTNEALSDGISEEIAAKLGRIPELNVKAPRSSFSLKDRNLTIQELGSALGVRYLVDGSLQKDARRLRVRVALVVAANDSTLWTNEYDRPLGDVFSMQDEIARSIASELQVKLAPATAGSLSRPSTKSAEAHELYLRGRFFFQRRDSMSLRKAREYFELAIANDPKYALAYAGLSDTYSHWSVFGYSRAHASMPRAKIYAARALALDSTLVEGHASRGFIATFYEWDWPVAGQSFRKAVALDPRYPSAHLWRAWYFVATDSVDSGIREGQAALALEPFVPLTNTRLITLLYYGRRYEDALRQAQKTAELDSTFFQVSIERARVLAELRRCDEAVAALARAPHQTAAILQGLRGYTYARCGHDAEARAELNRLLSQSKGGDYVSHYALAVIQAGLGDKEAAFSQLDSAYTEREWVMFLLKVEPAFGILRSDPRFTRLARKVGLRS